MVQISRRALLQSLAAAAVALGPPWRSTTAAQTSATWKVGGFTKPIQDLSFEDTARFTVDAGWDGIELALRAAGHVLPERADEDLPKLVSALAARDRNVLVLATDIRAASEPMTERVLRAAQRSAIRLYRLVPLRYREGVSIAQQIKELRPQLKELAALNRQLG